MTSLQEQLSRLSPEKRQLVLRKLQARSATSPASPELEGGPLVITNRGGPLPLSSAQQRLWFLDQLEGPGAAYIMTSAVRLRGRLDVGALLDSLREIVGRHEILRTTFWEEDGQPRQVISLETRLDVEVFDWIGLGEKEHAECVHRLIRAESETPFDLKKGPLIRVKLGLSHPLSTGDGEGVLVLSVHHIVADFWSMEVLIKEWKCLYEARVEGHLADLKPLPIQYADYAAWERKLQSGGRRREHVDYWTTQLDGAPPVLELPLDFVRPSAPSPRGHRLFFEISSTLADGLRGVAQRCGATPFMALQAVFALLLARTSRQRDVVVGTVVANRPRPELESMIGFFVNTLPLRLSLVGDPSFVEVLRRVKEAFLGALTHQELSFEQLVESLPIVRQAGYAPVFQATFDYLPGTVSEMAWRDLTWHTLEWEEVAAPYDLMLRMQDTPRGLRGALITRDDLFARGTAQRFVGHFLELLGRVVDSPEQPVFRLPMLTPAECAAVQAWSGVGPVSPEGRTAMDLFREQVQRRPGAFAVLWDSQRRTYRELEQRSRQVSEFLLRLGLPREGVVGLCLSRSAEMIAGFLGILRAGGVYLPLDPGYPPDRLAFILRDSGAQYLLIEPEFRGLFPEFRGRILQMDEIPVEPPGEFGMLSDRECWPDGAAYVIYTSGSTGQPKGVAVPHRGLVNLFRQQSFLFDLTPEDGILQFASISFDASIFEFLMALLSGARLVLVSKDAVGDPDALIGMIERMHVTVATLPPSLVRLFEHATLPGLRLLITAGEAAQAGDALHYGRELKYCNAYGPTEMTVWSASHFVDAGELYPRGIPIGRPIAQTFLHILDEAMQPVPIGVAGELYLGGAGLARGYWRQAALTAERFVPDPFGAEPGERLYRTGDLGRWTVAGEVEFLGRTDQQVKLRGFRIEPGEIEETLRRHPDVLDSRVVVWRDSEGEDHLVAYWTSKRAEFARDNPAIAREFLQQWLPHHMVPAFFVLLDHFPLTSNGKLDLRALPDPLQQARPLGESAAPPIEPGQEILQTIWRAVLGRKSIGLDDRFFEMGGHSLLAARLASRMGRAFKQPVPIRAIFDHPTVRQQAAWLARRSRGDSDEEPVPPLLRQPKGVLQPLSFSQQRLWFLHQLEGPNPAYNMFGTVRVQGPFQEVLFERGIRIILERHEALRMGFVSREGEPAQYLRPDDFSPVEFVDLAGMDADSRKNELERVLRLRIDQPFDLVSGNLLRVLVCRCGEEDTVFQVVMHHLVSDGWSVGLFVRELSEIYSALASGATPRLPELTVQFGDYVLWQRKRFEGKGLEREVQYWRQRLHGAPSLLPLPTDRPRPAAQSYRGSTLRFALPETLSRQWIGFQESRGSTLFMTLQAAFAVFLCRISRQDEVVIGTAVANRHAPETEPLIGFFANTLALRTSVASDPGFIRLLEQVQESVLEDFSHQEVPFEHLVEALRPDRNLAHSPIFQVMLVLQNALMPPWRLGDLALEFHEIPNRTAKFDLTVFVETTDSGLVMKWEYNTDLFDPDRVRCLAGSFETLLRGILAEPEAPVSLLPLTSVEERQRQLRTWNDTAKDYGAYRSMMDDFEQQAEAFPDRVAVVFEERSCSYGELNRLAEELAAFLQAQGIREDQLVGVFLDRSLELVVGLFGILKAGGAYVPLDPEYPPDRLAFMLKDSAISVVLTQERLRPVLASLGGQAIRSVCLDSEWSEVVQKGRGSVGRRPLRHPSQLAYMIYTSGSTGRPKGAMNTHEAIRNRLCWMQDAYRLGPEDCVLQKTPFSFDVSVWEFFWPLMTGARLVLARPGGHRDPAYLVDLIRREEVTTLHFVPPMLQAFLDEPRAGRCSSLRRVICSGEALPADLRDRFFERCGAELHNLYGPTEAAVDVSYWDCREGRGSRTVPIGRPIANTQLYVLDPQGQLVPRGVAGELHIGGINLARGYHARPGLTAEKFVPDPFASLPGARLYRTGDLARYMQDGSIEFLGRLDHQVKIRGFRIELGEIEEALNRHARVQESVVIVREDIPGQKTIAAYLTARPGTVPDEAAATLPEALRRHLKSVLPDYMVPGFILVLEALPLTPNGKINRGSLPAPPRQGTGRAATQPIGAKERCLAEIWQSLLGLEQVGRLDNFFQLGGDSILSIQMLSRARKAGLDLTVKQLFDHQTIADLARVAKEARQSLAEQGPVIGPVPMGPMQHWFFERELGHPDHWNQSVLVRVPADLQPELLEQAWRALLIHHDQLRARFSMGANGWAQTIDTVAELFCLQKHNLSSSDPELMRSEILNIASASQATLNVGTGPLLRAVWFNGGKERDGRLLIVIHHLVVDGVSWRILLEDLETAYLALREGKPPSLPTKTSSFRDWTERLMKGANETPMLGEAAYWLRSVRDAPSVWPMDGPGGENTEASACSIRVALSPEQTEQLLRDAPRVYRTGIQELLLAAVVRMVHRRSGARSLRLDMEGHGREEIFAGLDLSRTVGWFTALVPLCLHVERPDDWSCCIKEVKESLRSLPAHGLSYGALRYGCTDPEIRRKLGEIQHADVSFNYLGQMDGLANGTLIQGLTREPMGMPHDPRGRRAYRIDIAARIGEGCLEFIWTFSTHLHQHGTVDSWARETVSALSELIEHCAVPGSGGVTPSDFPLAPLPQRSLDQIFLEQPDVEDIYPLTPTQSGLLFHTQLEPGSGAYIQQMSWVLAGEWQPEALEEAWQILAARHPMLRTQLLLRHGPEPLQLVRARSRVPWLFEDWSSEVPDEQDSHWARFLSLDRARGFAMDEAPLMRCTLIRLKEGCARFLWTHHHLILDGWSLPLLLREVFENYRALLERTPQGRSPAPRFRDYVTWLQRQDAAAARSYWETELRDLPEATRLPTRPCALDSGSQEKWPRFGSRYQALSVDETARLKAWVQRHELTLSSVVQAAWALVLRGYDSGQEVLFNTTVSGRPAEVADVESMAGLFIATLPVRIRFPGAATVVAWLQGLHAAQQRREMFGYAGMADIQRWSGRGGRLTIPGSLVVFENFPMEQSLVRQVEGGEVREVSVIEQTHYPLTVVASASGVFEFKLTYDAALFDEATVGEMVSRMIDWALTLPRRGEELMASVAPFSERVPLADAVMAGERTSRRSALGSSGIAPTMPEDHESVLGVGQVSELPVQGVSHSVRGQRPPQPADREVRPTLQVKMGTAGPTLPCLGSDEALTSTEQVLAGIWGQVLRVGKVGADENFFDLGGDSILSLQIVSRASQAGLPLTVKDVFDAPTIRQLALLTEGKTFVRAQQGLVTGPVEWTPIQRWFLEQNIVQPQHWNQSILLRTPAGADAGLLESALRHLVAHHDALRLAVQRSGGEWHQTMGPGTVKFHLRQQEWPPGPEAARDLFLQTACDKAQSSMCFDGGVLLVAIHFNSGMSEPGRLALIVHHLAVDGVSWRILVEDLNTAYDQLKAGMAVKFPRKTTSYQEWASRLADLARASAWEEELTFWRAAIPIGATSVPTDFPSGENDEGQSRRFSIKLEISATRRLLRDVPRAFSCQINDVLLGALLHSFAKAVGAPGCLVDVEGHGRDTLFEDADVSRTVGWFTTIYPVYLEAEDPLDPASCLRDTAAIRRRIPRGGVGFSLLRYLAGDETRRQIEKLPRAQILFNYLGQWDQDEKAQGLLRPARESSGRTRHPGARRSHWLALDAWVSEGRLTVEWTYSPFLHRESTVRAFAEHYQSALQTWLNGCGEPLGGPPVPLKSSQAGLSDQEMISLLEDLD